MKLLHSIRMGDSVPPSKRPRRKYKISESLSDDPVSASEGELLANMLNDKDFPTVMRIVDKYKNGHYTILPYLTRIKSDLETINPYNLTKCCRLQTLILPNCNTINDNMLLMLPRLESLTIKSGSLLTGDPFSSSTTIRSLQIISHSKSEPDTLLTSSNIYMFSNLEMLHAMNGQLTDSDLKYMKELKVLVLEESRVTPQILNYLPKLELLVINKKLYKYVSSIRNKSILEKIGKLYKIQIYALENNISL